VRNAARPPSVWVRRLTSRQAVLAASVVVGLFLQTGVLPHLAVFGIKPDLLMVVVACWGLLYGPEEGFAAGLAAGLAQDLTSAGYLGLFALSKALVGLAMGIIQSKIFKESVWVATAAVGVAVLAHEVVIWLFLRVLGVPAPAVDILTVALPGTLYSMVLSPPIYHRLLLYRLAEWAREREAAGGVGAPVPGQR